MSKNGRSCVIIRKQKEELMEKRELGNSGIFVQPVGLGCMGFSHAMGKPVERDEAVRTLRAATEYGYDFFDTAECYVGSFADGSTSYNEELVGAALKGMRDKVVIATKMGVRHNADRTLSLDSSPAAIRRSIDQSLKKLGTDYIDLYYQHRIDPKVAPEEVANTMAELIRAGKIRAWGISETDEDYLRRAHAVCPVTEIENRYSMMARHAGGVKITAPGTYVDSEPTNFDGETLHGDAAYVFWQKPVNAKKNALVFLHGYGQSGKTWETIPDGRDGFQNIFLEKGWATYIVDEPRRGRAGQSTVPVELKAQPQDQLWFDNFRIGQYPNIYDNVAFPRDAESERQFFHQMTPDTSAFDVEVVTKAMEAVIDRTGASVLITHSAGGGPGWLTAIRNPKVKGVIALEPGTFPFLADEMPAVEATTSPFPASGMEVSEEEFAKLLKTPIVVYFGDNIPTGDEPLENWGFDNWRTRLNLANRWAEVMKAHGGDVEIVVLPDKGIKGNTHFLMSDLNNEEVADEMERWLEEKGLAE